MSSNFSSIESIFQMMQPADLLAAEKINLGNKPTGADSTVRTLQRLLIEGGTGGIYGATLLLKKLKEFQTTTTGDEDKKAFNRLINFYSTEGNLTTVEYPYMYKDSNNSKNGTMVTCDQITGLNSDKRRGRPMSILISRSPFITPMARDAQKVELFLNFLPTTVISRCVPYMELEFVFDRGVDTKVNNARYTTASMLKFLLGGDTVKDGPDAAMYNVRTYTDGQSTKSAAGMELFTAPQTLVNMNPVAAGSRYVDIIDPTRPFASLESVSIDVSAQPGSMSYKKATVIIKLHDRSRLSEVADLIQPTTYTRSTIWLTYGWRHPYEPASDSTAAQTYADFINNNMMVREAYGIKNSGFSFDAAGQVTITLEMWLKSVSELRDAKVHDDEESFKKISEKIIQLAREIGELRRAFNIDPPSGLSKEIRGYTILDSAEQGTFPTFKPSEVQEAISSLRDSLEKSGNIPKGKVDELASKLSELYKPAGSAAGKTSDVFDYKKQIELAATTVVSKKFIQLSSGEDPFLIFKDKNDKMKIEAGLDVDHPLLKEIEYYTNNNTDSPEVLKDGIKKSVVSFGKLFSVFMAAAMFSVDSIDEYQIAFYTMNDRCGPLSACSIAEFPIDLPVFLRQYKDELESRGTTTMTVEQFIKLAIDSQLGDIRSIGYGFRSKGLYKPWDSKGRDPIFADGKKDKDFESALASVQGSKGSFQMPAVEVYVETTHAKYDDNGDSIDPVDLLRFYETASSRPVGVGFAGAKKIVKIHIYDKTANPYRAAGQLLRSDNPAGGMNLFEVDSDEWVKAIHGDPKKTIDAIKKTTNGKVTISTKEGDTGINVSAIQLTDNTNNQQIKNLVSKMVPSLIYGMNSSAILEASVNTKHDANLAAAQLMGLNAGKKTVASPSGAGMGGLPLKIIPAQLSLRVLGCPLLNYGQSFFVDFNTGTTIDNIYLITGMSHAFSPGKFESSTTMAFFDAYGKYEGTPQIAEFMKLNLKPIDK